MKDLKKATYNQYRKYIDANARRLGWKMDIDYCMDMATTKWTTPSGQLRAEKFSSGGKYLYYIKG